MGLRSRKQRIQKNTGGMEIIFHILALALAAGLALVVLRNQSMITNIGWEDIYWERARFLAGQGGASRYSGNSTFSLGYSLVLLPICLLLESPYAAYKAALLLNICFLCASYFLSYRTVCRWFPVEDRRFLAFACLAAVLCPLFVVGCTYTRPDMIVLFFAWTVLYLLTELWESYSSRKLAALTVCLLLLGFLNIMLLGVLVAVIFLLGFYVRQEKLDVNAYLILILVVLLGLAFEDVSERVLLHSFYQGRDTVPDSSLAVFMDNIVSEWEKNGLYGLCQAIIGRLYAAFAGTFLLFLPGLWFVIRRVAALMRTGKEGGREDSVLDVVSIGLAAMFLLQMLSVPLCESTWNAGTWWVSLCSIDVILPAFLIIGILEMRKRAVMPQTLAVYLLVLCGCTCVTAKVYQTKGVTSFSKVDSSVLTIFGNEKMDIVSLVYFTACVVMLAGIILADCWQAEMKRKWMTSALRWGGGIALLVLYCGSGMKIYKETAGAGSKGMSPHVSAAASLISETQGECYYLKGTGDDNNIVVLQSLVPAHEIQMVENNSLERDKFYAEVLGREEDIVLITGVGSGIRKEVGEALPQYRLLYMTDQYALWAEEEGKSCGQIQEGVARRLETPSLWGKEEKKITYGTARPLTTGTYRLEMYIERNSTQLKKPAAKAGTLTVVDSAGTVQTLEFDGSIFDENGKGALVVEFTRKSVMENVTIVLEGEIVPYLDVADLYYWQISPEYTLGQNGKAKVADACARIAGVDESCGILGSVTYIEDVMAEDEKISLACFEEFLPGCDISLIAREDVASVTADYLLAETGVHAYLQVMDRYSVIYRDSTYTVLVRNGTPQYRKCQEEGKLLSEGTNLKMSAFEQVNADYKKKLKLELGTYSYHFTVLAEPENLHGDEDAVAATLLLYEDTELITKKPITNSEVMQGEFEVPFALRASAKKLKYKVKLKTADALEVTQDSIELVSRRYQYGMEEETFPELAEIVNCLGSQAKLSVIQSENVIKTEKNEYTYLQELVPECEVSVETSSEVTAALEDTLVMVHDLTAENMKLLEKYSIIGHAGKYTLMARSDGALLGKAVSEGIQVLNSGKKLSLESIYAMSGYSASEDVITYLPSANYKITVRIDVSDLDADDTIVLSLTREKTEGEITAEQDALVEQGYTKKKAKEMVDSRAVCGSATLNAYSYAEEESFIAAIGTSDTREWENLMVEGYTWHGAEVSGKILWVELA